MITTRSQLLSQERRVTAARLRARQAQARLRQRVRARATSAPALAAWLLLGIGIGRGLQPPEGRGSGRLLYWMRVLLPLLRLL